MGELSHSDIPWAAQAVEFWSVSYTSWLTVSMVLLLSAMGVEVPQLCLFSESKARIWMPQRKCR